jgi:transcriptional regulator with XRE-family HTH domain
MKGLPPVNYPDPADLLPITTTHLPDYLPIICRDRCRRPPHLPIICRSFAGTVPEAACRVLIARRSAGMSALNDHGKKRPNGKKIAELRKQQGLKQESLARETEISVRRLREIERNNHPMPLTDITAIATALKVAPGDITLDASPTKARSLLKLRAIRSATELSSLARRADDYEWSLEIDPSAETAADMQGVMRAVHRFVKSDPRPTEDSA